MRLVSGAGGGLGGTLAGLLLLPGDGLRLGGLDGRVAEDVGVAPDHLLADGLGHPVEVESAFLARHLAVEDHLQKQVAQFVAGRAPVATFDGLGDLVGFLDGVRHDGGEGLLDVPGAAVPGVAQALHDGQQAGHGIGGVEAHGQSRAVGRGPWIADHPPADQGRRPTRLPAGAHPRGQGVPIRPQTVYTGRAGFDQGES